MRVRRHFIVLLAILSLGAILRFWNLDAKPLWLDEVITTLFSLGRDDQIIPLGHPFPLSRLDSLFTLKPGRTCAQIADAVATRSVHPPLFFCWLYDWMNWVHDLPLSLAWKVRSFAALFGVGAIAALYQLNRILFSPSAGLLAAALMAVSPFAVYLSQEARHYTLPMLLLTLALLGLYQIHLDLHQQRIRPLIWLGWIAVNSVGFYVHYFHLLAFAAQSSTLIFHPRSSTSPAAPFLRTAPLLAIAAVCLADLPWFPTFLSHIRRPETDWLLSSDGGWMQAIAPLYHIPLAWVLMAIALPVEAQPLWISVPSVILMLLFTIWFGRWLIPSLGQLWRNPQTHLPTWMLSQFMLVVLLEFLGIAIFLGKDISQVPRYHFIYCPAVLALVGAGLSQKFQGKMSVKNWLHPIGITLLVGGISSGLVVANQVFPKSYNPQRFVHNLRVESQQPLLLGMATQNLQDTALGLSVALELNRQMGQAAPSLVEPRLVFLSRSPNYDHVWQAIAQLPAPQPLPLNLWLIAPEIRRADYPAQLAIRVGKTGSALCQIAPKGYHRLGVPYQLYHCQAG